MRVLVTGAKGQLGVELLDVLGRDHDVVGLDLPELDITTPEATRVIADARPAWVVHAAAWIAYLKRSRRVRAIFE